jgi:ADP-ribose pyrophosphatase YjhB (NUDIX family)
MTQTQEDLEKIEAYRKRLGKYPKPSITADVIAVRPSYSELGEGERRESPEFALEVLFIKRGQWPFEGCWALPGGFINPTETVEDGARRELREETSLESEHLIPIGVFSKPGRDMRARIISNAFVSILKQDQSCHVKGGDDAATAKWLLLKSPTIEHGRFSLPFHDNGKLAFSLSGSYREDELNGGTVLSVEDNPLAFDHAQIIAQAFLRLKSFDTKKLVFAFLPEKFTLSNYIDVYQYLTHNSVSAANIPSFRHQLTSTKHPLLEVCEDEWDRTHLPAKLYRRKLNP